MLSLMVAPSRSYTTANAIQYTIWYLTVLLSGLARVRVDPPRAEGYVSIDEPLRLKWRLNIHPGSGADRPS